MAIYGEVGALSMSIAGGFAVLLAPDTRELKEVASCLTGAGRVNPVSLNIKRLHHD